MHTLFLKTKHFFIYLSNKFKNLTIIKHILIFYLIITFIGSGLLMLPISRTYSNHIDYLDSLFTAASAFSDTGLVTKSTVETWTSFGQTIIAFLILMGGIGVIALKVYFFNILLNRPIDLSTRFTLNSERGSSQVGVTRKLILISVSTILILLLLGALVLTLLFYYTNGDFNSSTYNLSQYNPKGKWDDSLRFGFFHSISAINNAGFDIMSRKSISPYYTNYSIQVVFIILFIIGGVGYPVIYDVYSYFECKIKKETFRWSLFTKLSCITYLIISILGIALTFTFELTAENEIVNINNIRGTKPTFWNNPNNGTSTQKSMAIFFNTLSTRNAGFSTINTLELTTSTKILHSLMMFIGSAPSSTAGGIRTTTFAIILVSIISIIKNKKDVNIFKRKINSDIVRRSYVVFAISILLVLITSLIGLTSFDTYGGSIPHIQIFVHNGSYNYSAKGFADIWFETTSAFGTTGLSLGITSQLNVISKILFILLMFIGQLGVSSSLLVWNSKSSKVRKISYIEEDIIIG